jgi:hypothetical protein
MKKITWKSGWKTYAVCLVAVLLGVYDAVTGAGLIGDLGKWGVVAAGAVAALRHALSTNATAVSADTTALVQSILAEVSAPDALATAKAALKADPARVSAADIDKVQSIADLKALLTDAAKAV